MDFLTTEELLLVLEDGNKVEFKETTKGKYEISIVQGVDELDLRFLDGKVERLKYGVRPGLNDISVKLPSMDSRNMVLDIQDVKFKYFEFNGESKVINEDSLNIVDSVFKGDVVLNLKGYDTLCLKCKFENSVLYLNVEEPYNKSTDNIEGYSGFPYSLDVYNCEGNIDNLNIKYKRGNSVEEVGIDICFLKGENLKVGNINLENSGKISDSSNSDVDCVNKLDLSDLNKLRMFEVVLSNGNLEVVKTFNDDNETQESYSVPLKLGKMNLEEMGYKIEKC